ncbi:unnamed protein product [Polarella glacialis]|uniref:Uncharacterized protein n=1 Tax=Polarella glacialis TaxID=89957 RepID=A0A813LXC3_POLGL|nr:unnamed protein product [Polarella glacialis]
MQTLASVTKKALQKSKVRRQEQRNRCQELAKRVMNLQAEKAMAVRVCQENKSSFELRLSELGMTGGSGGEKKVLGALPRLGLAADFQLPPPSVLRAAETPAAGGTAHRRELRAISERLERHAEWLQSRAKEGTSAVTA